MNAFKILGIEPTRDKKAIKKAYAALVKQYHPEEDMQKWQEIHEAYQSALKWAEGRNYLTRTASVPVQIQEEEAQEILQQQISKSAKGANILLNEEEAQEEEELNDLFDDLEVLSAASKTEKAEQEKRELDKALAALDQMVRFHKLGYEDWRELFSREEYQQAIRQSDFLYRWSEILEKIAIDRRLYQLMAGQLKSIVQYQVSNEQTMETVGLIGPVELTGVRIKAAYARYREKRQKRIKIAVFTIFILVEVVPFVIVKISQWESDELKWKREMRDRIRNEYNSRYENAESTINIKGLYTVTDLDLSIAELNLDRLADFLMKADGSILGKVLPYTETLAPGVLVLGEDFNIRQALQEDKSEKEDGTESEYEMVPLSLPFSNRLLVGGESIDLPQDTVQFAIRTENAYDSVLLWIDPKKMGFEKGCEIYCFDGEAYQKARGKRSADGTQLFFYDVSTYQVLIIPVSRLEEEEYPVVLIPIK